jgi:hypothetical protein
MNSITKNLAGAFIATSLVSAPVVAQEKPAAKNWPSQIFGEPTPEVPNSFAEYAAEGKALEIKRLEDKILKLKEKIKSSEEFIALSETTYKNNISNLLGAKVITQAQHNFHIEIIDNEVSIKKNHIVSDKADLVKAEAKLAKLK